MVDTGMTAGGNPYGGYPTELANAAPPSPSWDNAGLRGSAGGGDYAIGQAGGPTDTGPRPAPSDQPSTPASTWDPGFTYTSEDGVDPADQAGPEEPGLTQPPPRR